MTFNTNEAIAQTNSRNNGTHHTHFTHLVTSPKVAFTLAESRLACITTLVTAKAAFTLAEVLITLAIIGVVAAITIPSLVKNYNEKAWATAQDVFTKRLEVAAIQLNTEEKLAGYNSTMDFVNELKKKIKIINVCDSNNLSKCFERTILTADGQEVDAASLKTSAQLAKEDWGTETVGVQFANGINALIAYNPQTDQQPFNNQFSATEASMAILYDVSGHKNPNTIGKDINQNANVKKLGCMIKKDLVGGMCISQILAPDTGYSALSKEECEQIADAGYGNNRLYCGGYTSDYWAGAVKACGGINNMPNNNQLTQFANYIYNTDSISSSGTTSRLAMDTTKASQFLSASQYSNYFYVWLGQENISNNDAYYRVFGLDSTGFNDRDGNGYSYVLAVCLDN